MGQFFEDFDPLVSLRLFLINLRVLSLNLDKECKDCNEVYGSNDCHKKSDGYTFIVSFTEEMKRAQIICIIVVLKVPALLLVCI